jgi:outer membrane protein TolC
MQYAQTVTDVDEAYWQIVAIAGKKRLASAYADLLHKLEKDAAVGMDAGVKTKSDLLQIKVKANEADLLLTQATNGLALSKMLLCQKTGLPLQTQITLADEDVEVIPVPAAMDYKDMDSILEDRPETRSLALASQIYLRQADMARADMMPRVALMGNFYITNPSAYNGFQKEWGSNFSVGVMVQIPIFHGFEALQKTRKAKAEASLYQDRYDDARDLINLQVTRQRKLYDEALEKLRMLESNMESAEENLRAATVGFEAGVIETGTVLMAQTGWLQAHIGYLDAGVELQRAASQLMKAEGRYVSDLKADEKNPNNR